VPGQGIKDPVLGLIMGLHWGSASSLASNFAVEQPTRNKETSKKVKAGFKGMGIHLFYKGQEFPLVMNATDWCQMKELTSLGSQV
jgi:hypothetical protein